MSGNKAEGKITWNDFTTFLYIPTLELPSSPRPPPQPLRSLKVGPLAHHSLHGGAHTIFFSQNGRKPFRRRATCATAERVRTSQTSKEPFCIIPLRIFANFKCIRARFARLRACPFS